MSVLTINQKLPSLNEYINVCRRNKYAGAKFKKEIEESIALYIFRDLHTGKLSLVTEPVDLHIIWYEKTKRRDCDNIQSGQKYILDALQKTNVLPNDNRKWVRNIYHKIIDSDCDKVVVEFMPAKE